MKDDGDIKHESRDKMKTIGDIRASQEEIIVELYRVEAGPMKMERNPVINMVINIVLLYIYFWSYIYRVSIYIHFLC
jgi:hypothetical protein